MVLRKYPPQTPELVSLQNSLIADYVNDRLKRHGNELVHVSSVADFPEPIAGVITLVDNYTYVVTTDVDLLGTRLVGGANTTLLGMSSENCFLTSTGLTGAPLITSEFSLPMRNITIRDCEQGFYLDQGLQPEVVAIDWYGVNFLNCDITGEIGTVDNFICTSTAVINSGTLKVTGTVGTISISTSIFTGTGAAYALIDVQATAVITRRFRVIFSSIIAFGSTVGINVDNASTMGTERYILNTVNFSGGGTYQTGVDAFDNRSLFVLCTEVENTSSRGHIYMQNNATVTPIADTINFVKIQGATLNSPSTERFDATDNRLTCRAQVSRTYIITAHISLTTTNNNVVELGFYESPMGAVAEPSKIASTANGSGRSENISTSCIATLKDGDYVELHIRNTTAANPITVDRLSILIHET